MSETPQSLKPWFNGVHGDEVARLNELPVATLLKLYSSGEIEIRADRTLAVAAARGGVPTSLRTRLTAFAFPLLLIAAPIVWYFFAWYWAMLSIIFGIAAFKSGQRNIPNDVCSYALKNQKVLDALITNGVVWFEPRRVAMGAHR